jgi:hypothetical protein
MSTFLSMGSHQYRLEDDTLVLRTGGELSLEQAQWLMTTLTKLVNTYGYSLLIGDASGGVTIPPHVRRWLAEWHKDNPSTAGTAIIIGASLMVRTLVTMINHAVRLLGRPTGDLVFVHDEAEARKLLPSRRALWHSRAKDSLKPPRS